MLERLATSIVVLEGTGTQQICPSLDQALKVLDMQASKSDTETRSKAPEEKTARVRDASQPKKLSYKDQREFDQIEEKIMEADERIESAQAALADPKVLADHTMMTQACHTLDEAQAESARLYARWDELEAMQG